MGLFDKLKGEFVDIIEWTDSSNDTMVWRFPRYQNEIYIQMSKTQELIGTISICSVFEINDMEWLSFDSTVR